MYHYVRNVRETPYPNIRGLSVANFIGQLDHLQAHYNFVDPQEMIHAGLEGRSLGGNDCVLTFDDGFIDHYETVFPELLRRGIKGAFFPPAQAILEGKLLDVHKIQHILGGGTDPNEIVKTLVHLIDEHQEELEGRTSAVFTAEHHQSDELDTADVVFIKHLLQYALPEALRTRFTHQLFLEHVGGDEMKFASTLYASVPQLQEMHKSGMMIGGHGYRHIWLGKSDVDTQRDEFDRTVSFLKEVSGRYPEDWVMCYPYGSFNETTLSLMKEYKSVVGLTTLSGKHESAYHLEAPRVDTIHLPFTNMD